MWCPFWFVSLIIWNPVIHLTLVYLAAHLMLFSTIQPLAAMPQIFTQIYDDTYLDTFTFNPRRTKLFTARWDEGRQFVGPIREGTGHLYRLRGD